MNKRSFQSIIFLSGIILPLALIAFQFQDAVTGLALKQPAIRPNAPPLGINAPVEPITSRNCVDIYQLSDIPVAL